MSVDDWGKLEKEIAEETPGFVYAFDYSMMKHLRGNGKSKLAVSFMQYIRSKRTPNSSTFLEYVDACLIKHEDLGFEEFKTIFDLKQFPIDNFASRICSVCSNILKTRYWKESIPIILEFLEQQQQRDNKETENSKENRKELEVDILKAALRKSDYEVFYANVGKFNLDSNELGDFIFKLWLDRSIPADVFFELYKEGNFVLTKVQALHIESDLNR